MADQSDSTPRNVPRAAQSVIYHDEPPIRKPPITETGIIGWLRTNLFGSVSDTILTLVASLFIIFSIVGFLQWTIAQADWDVITRNLRLFMNGRYPIGEIYRMSLGVVLFAFLGGLSWRILGRAPVWITIAAGVLLLILYTVPLLTNPLPYPPSYLHISATSEWETINTAFLIEEEQTLTLSLEPADPRAGIKVGFSDTDSATEAGQAQRDAALYDMAVARAEAGEAGVEMPKPLPEPDVQVTVSVLDGTTGEAIGTVTAAVAGNEPTNSLSLTIPVSGWYIIHTERTGTAGAYWLKVDGVEVISSAGSEQEPLFEKYGTLPEIEGLSIKHGDSALLRFRGERTFAEFLRLHVGPLFEASRDVIAVLTLVVVVGYGVGTLVKQFSWAYRLVNYAWALAFVLMVFLLRGFYVDKVYSEIAGLSLLFLSLAFLLPTLFGILNATFTPLRERNWFFRGGVILTLAAVVLAFTSGWSWPLLIAVVAGVVLTVFAQENPGRRSYLIGLAVGLGGTVLFYIVMQALFGGQISSFVTAESETWALAFVPTDRWGGLVLTLALALVSITASFPIGVLLALGRRSDLPVIRVFSIGAIEFVRGVPLITILFMASIMVPLLSPALAGVDSVVRAMIGMTFFSAAYVAEIVRGGLQAIPGGQMEAAKAVGFSGWQSMTYIILPQALRAVIPALVGQFISLFKDTSLVFIIGLIELLGVARAVINEAEFIGTQREALVFIGIIYFIGSYAMSYASRRIEESGAGAVRRM